MHVLYSRFFQKVLFDLRLVKDVEPYVRRTNRSLILGPDGAKMSKSKGNVIDPDEQVSYVGADAVKMYLSDATLKKQTGEKGRLFVEKNRGALERLLKIVEDA